MGKPLQPHPSPNKNPPLTAWTSTQTRLPQLQQQIHSERLHNYNRCISANRTTQTRAPTRRPLLAVRRDCLSGAHGAVSTTSLDAPAYASPVVSALAFADPAAYRSYMQAKAEAAKSNGTAPAPIPPHPLHTPTGYLFDALSLEAQNAEADRIDMARVAAIRELEKSREQLIRAEKALKDARNRIATLNNAALAQTSTVPPAS